MKEYVDKLKEEGNEIYWPLHDTNQNNPVGFGICIDNMNAIKWSDEVHILYDEKSQGVHFDIGMLFVLGKKVRLINKLESTPYKSFVNVLKYIESLSDYKK